MMFWILKSVDVDDSDCTIIAGQHIILNDTKQRDIH